MTRVGEDETDGQIRVQRVQIPEEALQTVDDEIEQLQSPHPLVPIPVSHLIAGAFHDAVRDDEVLRDDVRLLPHAFQRQQHHAQILAAQVDRHVFAGLCKISLSRY